MALFPSSLTLHARYGSPRRPIPKVQSRDGVATSREDIPPSGGGAAVKSTRNTRAVSMRQRSFLTATHWLNEPSPESSRIGMTVAPL